MGEEIIVTMPDGEKRPIPKGTKIEELAKQWDKEAVAAQVDGMLFDLSRAVEKEAAISFIPIHSRKVWRYCAIPRLTLWLKQ